MAKKQDPKPEPQQSTPDLPATELPYNPASDPNLSAQERLDALTRQHEDMHTNPEGTYPLEPPKK
jgi:hypothetical protein